VDVEGSSPFSRSNATQADPQVCGTWQPWPRLHEPSEQAVVTLGGKDHYLSALGSDESSANCPRFVAEFVRNGFRVAEVRVGEPYRVGELATSS
jgi:hypothetical protein